MLIFKSAIVPYLAYTAMKEWKYTHFQMQLTVPLLSVQILDHILQSWQSESTLNFDRITYESI